MRPLEELLRGIPPLLASHLALALTALVAAVAISLPLAILVTPRPRTAFVVVGVAGVIQTVPGLALLALMVPLLAATGWLSPFGFPPAVIALTLYAILPILRNAVTGLRGVDPAVIDAARGMGMSPRQIMRFVQLPLSAPVIAAGIRTAAVWTVGAATLATPVGQACLGNYIFAGLQTRNFSMLLLGIAVAAALAIVLDALLAAAEHALASRTPRRVWIPIALLALLVVVVIEVLPRVGQRTSSPTMTASVSATSKPAITHVRLGAKTFTEQYILVELLRSRLEHAGISVDVTPSLGSSVAFDALVHGDLDAYVDYSGTIWTNVMKGPSETPRWQVLAEIETWLARTHRVRSLGTLGFENTYALAVRRDTAERLTLHTLADLQPHAPTLSIGADYEFFGRAEWSALEHIYGLRFGRKTTFDPTLLYDAVTRGEVDVISAYSSDGRIVANDLVVLDDPAGALPRYDAMILLGARIADDAHIACVLAELHVSVESMRRANAMVDRDKASPADAAAWLSSQTPGRDDACGKPAR